MTGQGFGPANDVDLYDANTNTGICESVNVTGYGTFDCFTKSGEINITDPSHIKLQVNDSNLREKFGCEADASNCRFDCVGSANECRFEQSYSTSAIFTEASVTGVDRVSITANNMPDEPVDWSCNLFGTPCTVEPTNDPVKFDLLFEEGVPGIYAGGLGLDQSKLEYTYQSNGAGARVINGITGIQNQELFAIGSRPLEAVECSFAGGCDY